MDPFDIIRSVKLVPVVVLDNVADAEPLGRALVAGGLPIAEVTFRTAAAEDAIRAMSTIPDLLVGAGTVLAPGQADRAVAAGAAFVVSPGTSATVVSRCQELGVPVLPGAVTATEVMTLLDLGLSTMKFFPASTSGGPKAIKALASAFRGIEVIPTGGIDAANVAEYLAVPAVPAVGGSWMVPANLVKAHDFDAVTALCREAVAAVAGD